MNTSKIQLLPEKIRQRLNLRLLRGDEIAQIVQWLHRLPEARAVLLEQFRDTSINEEDIALWKQGGYRRWLAQRTAMAEVDCVMGEAREASMAVAGSLSDHLAPWIASRYAMATSQLAGESDGGLDWDRLRAFCRDLASLRRCDHSQEWLRIERERLELHRLEQKHNLEKQFLKWVKNNPEKIPRTPEPPPLTPEEKQIRMKQIFGLS